MDADRILCVYERIAGLMARMVEAARANEWDRLGELESTCRQFVDTLKAANLDVPMTPQLRAQRTRLIGEVLRADAQIRDLTEPLGAQLQPYLGRAPSTRAVNAHAARIPRHHRNTLPK